MIAALKLFCYGQSCRCRRAANVQCVVPLAAAGKQRAMRAALLAVLLAPAMNFRDQAPTGRNACLLARSVTMEGKNR